MNSQPIGRRQLVVTSFHDLEIKGTQALNIVTPKRVDVRRRHRRGLTIECAVIVRSVFIHRARRASLATAEKRDEGHFFKIIDAAVVVIAYTLLSSLTIDSVHARVLFDAVAAAFFYARLSPSDCVPLKQQQQQPRPCSKNKTGCTEEGEEEGEGDRGERKKMPGARARVPPCSVPREEEEEKKEES